MKFSIIFFFVCAFITYQAPAMDFDAKSMMPLPFGYARNGSNKKICSCKLAKNDSLFILIDDLKKEKIEELLLGAKEYNVRLGNSLVIIGNVLKIDDDLFIHAKLSSTENLALNYLKLDDDVVSRINISFFQQLSIDGKIPCIWGNLYIMPKGILHTYINSSKHTMASLAIIESKQAQTMKEKKLNFKSQNLV